MSVIREKQRKDHKNTYILYADTEKCCGKLWLKESLLEMKKIGYSKNEIKVLRKSTEIVVDTAIGNTENRKITEVVTEGSKFGPTMCCAKQMMWEKKLFINMEMSIR